MRKSRNKYGARKVWACTSCLSEGNRPSGRSRECPSCKLGRIECFDSKLEHARFLELCVLERVNAIRNLSVHPRFSITVNGKDIGINYEADFQYFEGNENVVEDVKGVETEVFRIKRKLVEALYPGLKIRVVK